MPRTITDIIPPSRRRPMSDAGPSYPDQMPAQVPPPDLPPRPPMYSAPRRRFPWGTALIAILVIAACVGVLYAFSGAKVEIQPTTNSGSVSGTYTATPNTGDLPFALVNVQKTATENVTAESSVTANDSAQGTITIYNEQSKAQALITNTRFQTAAGLIFRIHAPVTIPAGSATSPGTVTAIVYADAPGDSYNIGASSFTLPGLTDPTQFKEVYAKSTAAMVGGFSGTRPSVSQATDDSEHAKLQSTLAGEMTTEIAPQVPSGYVLVPGSVFVTYAPLPDAAGTAGAVAVSEQASATAVIFPEDALAGTLATGIIGSYYTGQPVTLESVNSLTLAAASSTTPIASAPFSFSLTGNATIVWKVDPAKVAGAVAGKSRPAAQSVLTAFPEIGKAYLTLRPFWRGSYPTDPASITVTVDTPTGG